MDAIASLIDQDSDFVFDALDGKEAENQVNGTNAEGTNINYREEPVAFFFVLFGIVVEALVIQPSSDTPEEREETLEVLQALKKILRPSISGNAIYQDAVFSETMELLDRLALTEGLAIQSVIVQITRNLCLSHPSAEAGESDGDHLSEDIEQLFELTRIIVLIIAGVVPNLGQDVSSKRHQLNDEAVALVRSSLEALVDASEIFPSIIRTDLHACVLHIFTTILGTGACQAHVVPQALPILKRFIQTISETADGTTSLQDQLRGCLQSFRSILANSQQRETESSLPCAKNTLLATTILLTSGSSGLEPNDPLITYLLDDMLDCLQDLGLAKVTANCMRSLLLVEPKNPTNQAIARYLLPRLLHYLIDKTQQDPENARVLVSHAVVSFATTVNSEEIATLFSFIIPALLHRATTVQGKDVSKEIAARLLTLAARDQGAFRGVVGKMTAEQKSFMEEVIREGGGGGRGIQRGGLRDAQDGEPSIALKMTFGL